MEQKAIVIFKIIRRNEEKDLEIPLNISANELVLALNSVYRLGIDTEDVNNCYLLFGVSRKRWKTNIRLLFQTEIFIKNMHSRPDRKKFLWAHLQHVIFVCEKTCSLKRSDWIFLIQTGYGL